MGCKESAILLRAETGLWYPFALNAEIAYEPIMA